MAETITGDDAIIVRVLEKIELAVFRTKSVYNSNMSASVFADMFAKELARLVREMRNAR